MKAKTESISVGTKVRISPQHWLRGYQEAVVVDFRPGAQNNWLVKFDSSYPGGGIEGDKLWLDERYFSAVESEEQTGADYERLQQPMLLSLRPKDGAASNGGCLR
jgi:hypothetical protein